jgi:type IV pilus assembly protein PilA
MIVIAIISAIVIPSLMNSRMAGNEASAVSSLRTLTTVNQQYRVRFQTYPSALTDLQASGYTDGALPVASKSGYTFSYTGTS